MRVIVMHDDGLIVSEQEIDEAKLDAALAKVAKQHSDVRAAAAMIHFLGDVEKEVGEAILKGLKRKR